MQNEEYSRLILKVVITKEFPLKVQQFYILCPCVVTVSPEQSGTTDQLHRLPAAGKRRKHADLIGEEGKRSEFLFSSGFVSFSKKDVYC